MRVLHIASGDLWAGAEVQTHLLVTELSRLSDIEIHVALMNEGELSRRLISAGIAVEVIDESRLSAPTIVCALRRLMIRFRPHVIHTHRTKENVLGLLANALSARAPMIRSLHGANEHAATWLRRPLQRMILAADELSGKYCTRRVIAVSQELGERLRTVHGYGNVVVVRNGIDVEGVANRQVRAPFKHEDSDVRHIGFAGRLEPVKRGDLFLEMAAALVRKNLPHPLHFHLFGDGSQRDMLHGLCARLGLAEHVTFHGHTPEVVSWLGCLDALVLCSDHEGLPMVLLEAIAAGAPVVAHAVGGITEVMRDDVGGILVTQHDAEHYAEAVARLLAERDTGHLHADALQRLAEEYSASRNAESISALYWRCLGNDRAAARYSES
jgi:glycosyltransferase involved in cell wall biosynthesis